MDITTILIAVAVVAGVGVIIGILLGVAGEKFKVPASARASLAASVYARTSPPVPSRVPPKYLVTTIQISVT